MLVDPEAGLVWQPSPEALALAAKRQELSEVRLRLMERETELHHVRAQLAGFEGLYLRQVGVLYAELDALLVRLREREASLQDTPAARERADEARRRARESYEAAYGSDEPAAQEEIAPSADLKRLFREVAKRMHPDHGRDDAERQYLHLLMARANQAYSRGQGEVLQRLLDNFIEVNGTEAEESRTAELLRVSRQIQQAHRELAQLEVEYEALRSSEVAELYRDAEAATLEHRDLLAELATRVADQISEAQRHLQVGEELETHG